MIFAIKVSDFGEDFFVKKTIFVNYYSLVLGHPWIENLVKNLKNLHTCGHAQKILKLAFSTISLNFECFGD